MTQKNSYKLSFLLSLTGFILGLLLVFIGLSGVSVGHAETRNGANKELLKSRKIKVKKNIIMKFMITETYFRMGNINLK
nr:hypothetical protein [Streptococcus pyogenes]